MSEYKVNDYHREVVSEYYKRLINRFGIVKFIRHLQYIKRLVWTRAGLVKVENKIDRGG